MHDVVWDAELSAAAALTIAAAMEYTSHPSSDSKSILLDRVAEYWLVKQDWSTRHGGRGAKAASQRSARFGKAANAVKAGKEPVGKVARDFCTNAESLHPLKGDPVVDWKLARNLFLAHADLKDIYPSTINPIFSCNRCLGSSFIKCMDE